MTENLKVTVKLTKQLLDFALNITDEFKSRLIAEILSVNISKHLFFLFSCLVLQVSGKYCSMHCMDGNVMLDRAPDLHKANTHIHIYTL